MGISTATSFVYVFLSRLTMFNVEHSFVDGNTLSFFPTPHSEQNIRNKRQD